MALRANADDIAEGQRAYGRYHRIMRHLACQYDFHLSKVVAVFVSLSPNTDYISNLRSTVSVLAGVRRGLPPERIQVSTYRHCLWRAYEYVTGAADFLECTKGPKVRAFYHNVLDPHDQRFVTVDGHMVCIWRGQDLTMREALVRGTEFEDITQATKALAFRWHMVPCQMQAVLWHTRKRLAGVKYEPQQNLWPVDDPNMLVGYPDRVPEPQHVAIG